MNITKDNIIGLLCTYQGKIGVVIKSKIVHTTKDLYVEVKFMDNTKQWLSTTLSWPSSVLHHPDLIFFSGYHINGKSIYDSEMRRNTMFCPFKDKEW